MANDRADHIFYTMVKYLEQYKDKNEPFSLSMDEIIEATGLERSEIALFMGFLKDQGFGVEMIYKGDEE